MERKWKEHFKPQVTQEGRAGPQPERKTLSLARIGEQSPIDQHRLWLRNTEWKVYGLLRHSPMGIQKEKQNLSLRPFPPLSNKNWRFIFMNRGIIKRINPQRKDRGIGIDPDPSIQPKEGKRF